jgi:hypothetical protein
MLRGEVAYFIFLGEMIALLIPKFPEARFAETCKLGEDFIICSKDESGFPVQLARNVVNRRIRHKRNRRFALARKGRPGSLAGFQNPANCPLSPGEPCADLDGSESVYVMVENPDFVALAE